MTRGDALVLFGATGDLARKKLFSALYQLEAQNRLNLPVIGVALSEWDDEQFRDHARSAIGATVKIADPVVVQRLGQLLTLVGGDSGTEETVPPRAHRLRTPLAVIVGYIEILAMRDTAGGSTEVLEHLREASAELAAAIDDVVAAEARDRSTPQG